MINTQYPKCVVVFKHHYVCTISESKNTVLTAKAICKYKGMILLYLIVFCSLGCPVEFKINMKIINKQSFLTIKKIGLSCHPEKTSLGRPVNFQKRFEIMQ